MDKNVSLTFFPETTDYRAIAQKHWGLTDEQMKGVHVHHEPPRALGGRNIPEHLYVCSPSIHLHGWHKGEGSEFFKMASEGGKLSAIVRRRKAEEKKNLSKEERERLKVQKRERVKARKEKEKKNREYSKRVNAALKEHEERNRAKKEKLEELISLQEEMIAAGLILPDPEGLLL
jgi:hypothetical protein